MQVPAAPIDCWNLNVAQQTLANGQPLLLLSAMDDRSPHVDSRTVISDVLTG